MTKRPTRRDALFALSAGAVSVLTNACKKQAFGELTCVDVTGLAPDDVAARAQVAYADRSLEADKLCVNCQQYIPPPSDGTCGTCKVMKGPVHPLGSCKVFAKKS